jgi:hypothetical protein
MKSISEMSKKEFAACPHSAPHAHRTSGSPQHFRGSEAGFGFGGRKRRGARATRIASATAVFLQILPGRIAIDRDPATVSVAAGEHLMSVARRRR